MVSSSELFSSIKSEVKSIGSFVSSCVKHKTLNHQERIQTYRAEIGNAETVKSFIDSCKTKDFSYKDIEDFYRTLRKRNIDPDVVRNEVDLLNSADTIVKPKEIKRLLNVAAQNVDPPVGEEEKAAYDKKQAFKNLKEKIINYAGPIFAVMGVALACVGAPIIGLPMLAVGLYLMYPKAKELVSDVKEAYAAWKHAHPAPNTENATGEISIDR